MVGVGAWVSNLISERRLDALIEKEQLKTHNALYNLNYEMIAHEQDVGLLKKENATLHRGCEP